MKLSRIIVTVGVIPIILVLLIQGVMSGITITRSIEDQAQKNLSEMRDARMIQLRDYFKSIEDDLTLFATSPSTRTALSDFDRAWELGLGNATKTLQALYISDNPNPIGRKDELIDAGDGSLYSNTHAVYHPYFRDLLLRRGYYDIFLIDRNGDLIYSVFKEQDYATNLVTGEWQNTGLAEAYRGAMEQPDSNSHVFVDFQPYGPSNDAPASFIAAPVFIDGKVEGVLAFQMPVDRLNAILSNQKGLRESGEAVLIGADFLARNDTALASGSVLSRELKSEATQIAMAGVPGSQFDLLEGVERLIYFDALYFKGTMFGLLLWEDTEEIYAPLYEEIFSLVIQTLLVLLVFGAAGIWIGVKIAAPIRQVAEIQEDLATGNLDVWIPENKSPQEVGMLCKALYKFKQETRAAEKYRQEQEQFRIDTRKAQRDKVMDMADSFEGAVGSVIDALSSSATELSATSNEVSEVANRTAARSNSVRDQANDAGADIESVTNAVGSINKAIEDVSAQVSDTSSLTDEAARQTADAAARIDDLNAASAKINDIVSLIAEIAEQTNLLALNATIEAARAGEAGKGFAVVASEVKALAAQTQRATDEIGGQVAGMLDKIRSSTEAVRVITNSVDRTNTTMGSISEAVDVQAAATHEVAQATRTALERIQAVIVEINHVAEDAVTTGSATEELQTAAAELARNSNLLTQETDQFIARIRSDENGAS